MFSATPAHPALARTAEAPSEALPTAPKRHPTPRFLLAHPAHFIALGAGSGLSPVAPGTVGTLWAWLAFVLMQQWLAPAALGGVIAASLPVAWWAGSVTARHMGVADPGSIVADEIVAFWIVLWLVLPAGFWAQAVAFALFRYFDAAKPGPVGWADTRFKPLPGQPRWWRAGWGILFDDLVAAFCTLLVIALFTRWG